MSRNWLDDALLKAQGAVAFLANGVAKPLRKTVNLIGVTIVDNPGQDRLDITIAGAAPSSALPQALGPVATGSHTLYSRDDHVHAHGNLAGGSLHAAATASVDGFMDRHDKGKLDSIDVAQLVMQSAWKQAVRCVVTTNVALDETPSEDNADDIGLEDGDRVLLVAQTDKTENGLYVLAAGVLVRPADFDASSDIILGLTVRVIEGRQYASSAWYLSNPTSGAPTLGFNALEFSEVDVPQLVFDLDSVSALPLRVAGRNRVRFDATALTADGRLVLARSLTGHSEGGYFEGFIPADLTDQVTHSLGDDALVREHLDPDGTWDAYDPTRAYEFFVLSTNSRFFSGGRRPGSSETTAPTVLSATVDVSDADKLIVVFSERVFLDLIVPIVGLSVTVTAGAACTLTALVSGNGTTTVTFDLSRDLIDGDALKFVIGSTRTLQDLNGNKIATNGAGVSIDLSSFASYVMPGQTHVYLGSSLQVSGSDCTAWNDTVGTHHLVASATKPTTTTLGGKPACTIISGSYFKADLAGSEDLSVFAILVVYSCPTATGSYETLAALGLASNVLLNGQEILVWPGLNYIDGERDAQTGTGHDETFSGGVSGTAPHAILFTGDHAGAKIYVDNVEVATSSTAVTAAAAKRFVLGVAADLSTSPATGARLAEVRFGNQKLTGASVTAAFAHTTADYGVP